MVVIIIIPKKTKIEFIFTFPNLIGLFISFSRIRQSNTRPKPYIGKKGPCKKPLLTKPCPYIKPKVTS